MSTIRVGVAGLGYWGPNLARNFAAIAGCEVAWLCDGDPAAIERGGALVPGARRTADLDAAAAVAALERTPPAERPPLYGDGRAGERVAAALVRSMGA